MTRYRKFIVAILGAITTAVTQGLVPDEVSQWVPVLVAFVTAIGVYATPNQPPPGEPADPAISEQGQQGQGVLGVIVAIVLAVLILRLLGVV